MNRMEKKNKYANKEGKENKQISQEKTPKERKNRDEKEPKERKHRDPRLTKRALKSLITYMLENQQDEVLNAAKGAAVDPQATDKGVIQDLYQLTKGQWTEGDNNILNSIFNEYEKASNGQQNDFKNQMKLFTNVISKAGRGKGNRKDEMVKEIDPEIKQLITDFVEKMGAKSDDVEKHFDKYLNKANKTKNAGNYMQKRAVIVKKPENVIEAAAGQNMITEIEILNDTFWPWKQGCILALADEQSDDVPIELNHTSIDMIIGAKQEQKIEIPFTVLNNIVASDRVYNIALSFKTPQGREFGMQVPLQVRVNAPFETKQ